MALESAPQRSFRLPRKIGRRIAIVLVAGGALYFAVAFADMALAAHRLGLKAQGVQTEISRLELENKRLRNEASFLQTDEAIERLAREQLGWARPGETSVLVITPTPEPVRSQPSRPARTLGD